MSTQAPARAQSVRVRRVLVLAGCGVLGVGLAACESTEQESARIGRESEAAAVQTAPSPSAAAAHPGSTSASRRPSRAAPLKGSGKP